MTERRTRRDLLLPWFGGFAYCCHCRERNQSDYQYADTKTFQRRHAGRTLRPAYFCLHCENLVSERLSVNVAPQ